MAQLGGGFKTFYFHTYPGKWLNSTNCFSSGLVQPPPSHSFFAGGKKKLRKLCMEIKSDELEQIWNIHDTCFFQKKAILIRHEVKLKTI